MTSLAHPNLTVTFDPSLPEHWGSLREYVAFRVQEQRLNASQLAGKMDLSPSALSRKLNQPEGDTQRLNVDDLENYIRATKDIAAVVSYLVSKYMETPEQRQARAMATVEEASKNLQRAIEQMTAAREAGQ